MRRQPRAFAAWGIVVAAAAAAFALAVCAALALPGPWSLLGWAPAALAGVGGGAWLARSRGRGFFVAFGTATALRFATLAGGLILALHDSRPAAWAFLVGFASAFVALAAFEAVWFLRAARVGSPVRPARAGFGS